MKIKEFPAVVEHGISRNYKYNNLGILETTPLLADRYDKISTMFSQNKHKHVPIKNSGKNATICGLITNIGIGFITIEDHTDSRLIWGDVDNSYLNLVVKIIIFDGKINKILLPGIKQTERRIPPDDIMFISDTHFTSKDFAWRSYHKMLDFLDDKNRKIKYILHAGDLINKFDICTDNEVRDFLGLIPNRIKMFIIPGNHDVTNKTMPQNAMKYDVPSNIQFITNPSMLYHKQNKILLTHGEGLGAIVNKQDMKNMLKTMLKSRLLSNDAQVNIADNITDSTVIDQIPNIIHIGHTHNSFSMNYNGIRVISTGSWINDLDVIKEKGWSNPGNAMFFKNNRLKSVYF